MPYVKLVTNVQVPDEKAFALEFSKVAAETLGKPEKTISVSYQHVPSLTFAGTFDPAAQVMCMSLGLDQDSNRTKSAAFSRFLKDKLGVENDRAYIDFYDAGTGNIGYKGTTVAEIRKQMA